MDHFEVVMRERKVRGSICVDRFWVVRDWFQRGAEALRIGVTYPGAEKLARDYAARLNSISSTNLLAKVR